MMCPVVDSSWWYSSVGDEEEVSGRITSPGERSHVSTYLRHQPTQASRTPPR